VSERLRVAMTIEQCWHRVPGGTAAAALGLARSLRDVPELELIGVAAAHRRPTHAEWRPPLQVRHLPLPRALLYESWHLLRRPRVEHATGDVDVIHATGIAVPPRTAPLVVTVHDLSYLVYPEHFTQAGMRFFRQALELTRRDADLVLCSSEATLRHCVEAGFDEGRLRVVPLGAQTAAASEEDVERVRSEYGLRGRYVLWVGTLEPRKNLPRLLEAFRGLDTDAELVLVGPRGWNQELELPPRVRPLGFVPGADLPPLHAGATAFAFPSLLEGFGMPVVDAMVQGTPVVSSSGTSTEEIVGDAGVIVDPLNVAAIRDGLARLLDDEELAPRLGEAGRARAASYTWERTAELTAAAYVEVAGR
jgi:glycosyltransferase involved in cell wall biosynthesis